MREEWRELAGGEHEVSSFGRVRRIETTNRYPAGFILKGSLNNKNGYLRVRVLWKKKKRLVCIQILVAEAFLGPKPKGKEVNHKDTIKANNRLSNLEYLTPKKNMEHAVANDLLRNRRTKLKLADVLEIRRTGYKRRVTVTAKKYGIGRGQVAAILQRKYWKRAA